MVASQNDGVRRSSGTFPSEEILYIYTFLLVFNLVKTRQSGKSAVESQMAASQNDGVRRSSGMFPSRKYYI